MDIRKFFSNSSSISSASADNSFKKNVEAAENNNSAKSTLINDKSNDSSAKPSTKKTAPSKSTAAKESSHIEDKTSKSSVSTGTTKPLPAALSAVAKPKASLPSNDFDMGDSDDDAEGKQTTRKRLKSAKEISSTTSTTSLSTASSKPMPSTASNMIIDEPKVSSKRSADKVDEKFDDVSPIVMVSPIKKNRTLKPVKAEVLSASELKDAYSMKMSIESVLKPIETSSNASLLGDSKKRKEIVGGVDAFFGNPVSSSTSSTSAVVSTSYIYDLKSSVSHREGNVTKEAELDMTPTPKRIKPEIASKPNLFPSPSKQASPIHEVSTSSSFKKSSASNSKSSSSSSGFNEAKFVITGVLHSMTRDDLNDYIMNRNGKVATAVSGRTDYLIIGHILEDGRSVTEGSKYRAAMEKNVKILNEEEFLELARAIEPESQTTITAVPSQIVPPIIKQQPSIHHSMTLASPLMHKYHVDNRLWVDKYRPSSLNEIIGCNETIKKLADWISKWEAVHIQKSFKVPYTKENPGAKLALLSGPPGVGKTTMASIIAKHYGYEVLELNASDSRNKKSISENLRDVVTSSSINLSGLSASNMMSKRVIIMDEVDGMSGNSDRGGIQELLSIAKLSKNPIICICNDRQSPKIRSLANSCYDLRVKRPTKTQIASRMVTIASAEGLQLDNNAAELLVEQSGNDIRQVLHALQMWQNTSSNMTYMDLKSNIQRIEKDKVLRQSPFDACLTILAGQPRGASSNLDERYNSFFIDYSLLPLMIQQNYIDSSKAGIFRNPGLDDVSKMMKLTEASDAVSDIDLVAAALRGDDQHWELLPSQAAFTVRAGSIVNGFQAFPTFPAWLGKNSTTGKIQRLTKELVYHTSLSVNQNFNSLRLEYVPFLRHRLLNLLTTPDIDTNAAVAEVIAILDSYGLSRDDFMETFKELQFIIEKDDRLIDRYEKIDSKLKAQLTRAYNSMEHSSQALVASQTVGKKKAGGRSKAVDDEDDYEQDDGDDGPVVDEVEEEEEVDLSKYMKKGKASASAKSSSSSSSNKAASSSSSKASSSSSSSKGSKKK